MRKRNEKNKNSKSFLLYFATVILSVLLLFVGNKIATQNLTVFNNADSDTEVIKASVEEILDRTVSEQSYDDINKFENVEITFKAKFLGGYEKGKTVTARQNIDGNIPIFGTREIKQGDKILIVNDSFALEGEEPTEENWHFIEFVRTDGLLILGAVLVFFLLLFGRKQGFNTLLSLVFTCISIFGVFIPSILSGKNIYLSSSLICLYTIVMTFLIVNGYNKKSLAASLGAFGGIIISGGLTLLMSNALYLTGVVDEDSVYITNIATESPIDLKAIIFAAIIIGALGAIMDISMSISSSLWEVKSKANSISPKAILKSGMNIGRDVIGTMANTLILAYIGSSLSVVLLLSAYTTSFLYLMNREMIIVEILQALIGSFGILLTIPLTSLICAAIYSKKDKTMQKQDDLDSNDELNDFTEI